MNFPKIFMAVLCLHSGMPGMAATIEAGRSIEIQISGVPERDRAKISGLYTVAEDGSINLPFIGRVPVAGMEAEQLHIHLQDAYKKAGIFVAPVVSAKESRGRISAVGPMVLVGGQVARPGPLVLSKDLTILTAIQAAGGATVFGNMKRVRLVREGKVSVFDATKPEIKETPLRQNDTIEVPTKDFSSGK